jgi:hypothetical protein
MAKEMPNFSYEVCVSYSEFLNKRRRSTTWDRRLYFPYEGRRATDFYCRKKLIVLS